MSAHTSLELEREGLDPNDNLYGLPALNANGLHPGEGEADRGLYATSTAWLQVPEEPNARLFNKPDEPNS